MYVDVRGTDDPAFHRALAEFKKKCKKAEIMSDVRRHEYYQKPSVRLKLKKIEALKRRRREEQSARKQRAKRTTP